MSRWTSVTGTTPTKGCLTTRYDLACNRPHQRQIFSGKRVSNLEFSGLEVDTLPLGHRGLHKTKFMESSNFRTCPGIAYRLPGRSLALSVTLDIKEWIDLPAGA
ncbi:hypothetical protein AVEN_255396-1 [Araneus ventricosus]|uniref:Uncharacterized protein n=1 Tax=Araneus ventricosus TaxID=182803 RepID=A0A4Y2HTM4_ARAVE|nr:hypothetical protein AVEN_255396-1 [Araneus ventricosus]